jgi:hypothetical protein
MRTQNAELPHSAPHPTASSSDFNADHTRANAESPARRRIAAAASVVALSVYAAYLTYRAAFTLNPDALVFSLLVWLRRTAASSRSSAFPSVMHPYARSCALRG